MKRRYWQIALGVALIAIAVAVEIGQYLIYRDSNTIFVWLINGIAFIPIQVLLVTLIIDRLLNLKEKEAMLAKLNMVIGAFFSEVGKDLLRRMVAYDAAADETRRSLLVSADWTDRQFAAAAAGFRSKQSQIDARRAPMDDLKRLLVQKREFMVRLLENGNLLEHETFTDLLWAVFHLTEELSERQGFDGLPEKDVEHLSGDMKRVYNLLIAEWLIYLKHLQVNYPYLFSLAVRTNPFDANASVEIR